MEEYEQEIFNSNSSESYEGNDSFETEETNSLIPFFSSSREENNSPFFILKEINRILSLALDPNPVWKEDDLKFVMKFKEFFKFKQNNQLLNETEEQIGLYLEMIETKQRKRNIESTSMNNFNDYDIFTNNHSNEWFHPNSSCSFVNYQNN